MGNKYINTEFHGKREEPYTIEEVMLETGLKRWAARRRLLKAIKNPEMEKDLLAPLPLKSSVYRKKYPGVEDSDYVNKTMREFDRQTLPSERLLNKYFRHL